MNKLLISKYQVSKENAEKYVLMLANELRLPIERKNDLKKIFKYKLNNVDKIIDPKLEIKSVMETGKADSLQHLFDSKDRFLNAPLIIGLATDALGVGGKTIIYAPVKKVNPFALSAVASM